MKKHLGVLTITWDGKAYVLMTSKAGVIQRYEEMPDISIPDHLKEFLKQEDINVQPNKRA